MPGDPLRSYRGNINRLFSLYIICASMRQFCVLASPAMLWRSVKLQGSGRWRYLPSGGNSWISSVEVCHLCRTEWHLQCIIYDMHKRRVFIQRCYCWFYCKCWKITTLPSVHILTSLWKNCLIHRFVGWQVDNGEFQHWPSRSPELKLLYCYLRYKREQEMLICFSFRMLLSVKKNNFDEKLPRRDRMCTEIKGTLFEYFSYPNNICLSKGTLNYSLKVW